MEPDPSETPAGDAALQRILAEYLQAVDAGAPLERGDVLARHPEHARELAEFFSAHDCAQAALAHADQETHGPSSDQTLSIEGYADIEEVGRGGMGVVYKARQISLGRIVAIKMVHPARLADRDSVARLRAEATSTAALQHPHIVAIHEVGAHAGRQYIVMDYVDGGSLADALRSGPLPAEAAAAHAATIADAVAHAHAMGVIHRDLKPSNILMTRDGFLRVTDFGIARRLADESNLTVTGAVVGTPSYMPPEQARGQRERIGPASDVYAIGAILYELVTGRPPFRGATAVETLEQVTQLDPVPPRLLNPVIARDLETICLKCLEKSPEQRYASADRLAEDLRRFLDHRPIHARRTPRLARWARWCRRNPLAATLLAATASMVLFVAVVSGLFSMRQTRLVAELQSAKGNVEAERDLADTNAYRAQTRQALAAWEESDWGEARRLLDAHRPVPGQPDRRHWEWYLVDALCHGPALAPLTHPTAVAAAAWSPDGTRIAAAMVDGKVRIWDVAARRPVHELTLDQASATCVDWSPDGALLAAGGLSGVLGVWDTQTGAVKSTARGHWKAVRTLAWSPDGGQIASGGDDQVIRLGDAATGRALRLLRGHKGRVAAIEWDRAGRRLASCAWDDAARIWDATTGSGLAEVAWLTTMGKAQDLAWSPDGTRLAFATWGGSLAFADATSGAPVQTATTPQDLPLQSVAWHPDGTLLATTGYDRIVRVWDSRTGSVLHSLRGHSDWGLDVDWSPDGRLLASASKDGTVRLWKPTDQLGSVLRRAKGAIYGLAWSPDGQSLASAGESFLVVQSSEGQRQWRAHAGYVFSLAWSPTGAQLASGGADRRLRVWNPETQTLLAEFSGHRREVASVAWSPDGTLLASLDLSGHALLWDVAAKTRVRRIDARSPSLDAPATEGAPLVALAWRPGSATLAIASGREVALWTKDSEQPVATLPLADHVVEAVAWSPTGDRLAVAGQGRVVQIWDGETLALLATLRGHGDRIQALAWHPLGTRIASGGWDQSVRVWDPADGELALALRAHESWVSSLSWHPDGKELVSGGWDATVRIWTTVRSPP